MTKTLRRPIALLLLTATFSACPRKEDDEDAPALPAPDTMTFFELKEGARSTEATGQALTVPRGRHHVALRYWNPLVAGCGAVSAISALFLMAVALRNKESRPPSPR